VNERSREGLKQIESGIHRREGFALVCGDVGTGKTTLSWALLEKLDKMSVRTALVQNPMASPVDVLKCILQDLGARPPAAPGQEEATPDPFDTSWMAGLGQMELVERLNAFLVQMARKALFTVVIIDEAQRLSIEALEQVRLLSNLEAADRKLMQTIFVGQPELYQMLQLPQLRQLNQRITVRFETRPLSRVDSRKYIRHRLRVARAIPRLKFSRSAYNTIYRLSRGYPRVINMICDRALMCSFRADSHVVTAKMVRRGFRALGASEPRRTPVWVRRLVPATGIAVVILLVTALLVMKVPSPGPDLTKPAPIAPSTTAAPAAGQLETPKTGLSSAGLATPAPAAAMPSNAEASPSTTPDMAETPGQAEYLLQVSSFRGLQRAKAVSEELQARGIPSFYEYHETERDGGWYAIYAGPYRDVSVATQVASTLEATLGETPLLRQRGSK